MPAQAGTQSMIGSLTVSDLGPGLRRGDVGGGARNEMINSLQRRIVIPMIPTPRLIAPTDVKPRLTAGPEIAFLDVREAGQYGEGHPFFAVNVPYSRLELEISGLVPRKATPIVLLDDGDGVAGKAARRLAALGYSDVAMLDGGAPGWAKAGFTLFKGVNLPSKAFGEIVEHVQHTPSLSAEELKARVDKGEQLVILDGRSPQEYRRMTIPGARSIPNAELAHRLPALVTDDMTTIVVNCAGRTRSIIGAQSLRNAGVKNPVIALRNGTQGWMLAGLKLENGTDPGDLPPLDVVGLAQSQARAQELITRHKLPVIDRAELSRWQADNHARPICSMYGVCQSIRLVTSLERFMRRAGNSCRPPISGWAHAARASCCATTPACAPRPRRSG